MTPENNPSPRSLALVAVVIVIAVGVMVALVASRPDADIDGRGEQPPPGFDGSGRDVDRTPFELAEPTTTAGPTTVPGSAGSGRGSRRTTTTTTTTSTTTTTTTTTTLPTRPIVPESVNSICGMVESIQSIHLIFTDPTLDVRELVERLVSNMDRYVALSPPGIRDEVAGLQASITLLAQQLEAADWDTSDRTVQRSVVAIRDETPPFENFQKQGQTVLFVETATCE